MWCNELSANTEDTGRALHVTTAAEFAVDVSFCFTVRIRGERLDHGAEAELAEHAIALVIKDVGSDEVDHWKA